jgi:hypothetical protein
MSTGSLILPASLCQRVMRAAPKIPPEIAIGAYERFVLARERRAAKFAASSAGLSGARHQRGMILNPYRFGTTRRFATHFDGTNNGTDAVDIHGHTITWNAGAKLTNSSPKFGATSLILPTSSDTISTTSSDYTPGAGDWRMQWWTWLGAAAASYQVNIETRDVGSVGFAIYFHNNLTQHLAYANNATVSDFSVALSPGTWVFTEVSRTSGVVYGFCGGLSGGTIADSRTLDLTRIRFGGTDGGGSACTANTKWDDFEFYRAGGNTGAYTAPTTVFP